MMQRWRGLKALVQDAVDHGSRAVERLQKEAASRPFDLLEQIPQIRTPVKGIREIHDTAVSSVHEMIRLVNRVAGETIDGVLDALPEEQRQPETPAAPTGAAPGGPAESPPKKRSRSK
jgi:hypothetical protein